MQAVQDVFATRRFVRYAAPVIGRFSRVVMVVALCVSIGAHWAALQSIAWATMLVDNSRQFSLSEAVARTFDGDHPCDLCKGIQHSKKQSDQQQKQTAPAAKKFDLRLVAAPRILFPPTRFDLQHPIDLQFTSRIDAPPVPPPRTALS